MAIVVAPASHPGGGGGIRRRLSYYFLPSLPLASVEVLPEACAAFLAFFSSSAFLSLRIGAASGQAKIGSDRGKERGRGRGRERTSRGAAPG